MSLASEVRVPLGHPDQFFIGGQWVAPSSGSAFDVIDSSTEELYFRAAEAQAPDMDRAVGTAREAFDDGPWPRLSHAERAGYLKALGDGIAARGEDLGEIWPRQSGVLQRFAKYSG
ncbi:MAG: aldehyde dehydrogenase family protein, partial [Acidimicrobiia bacterium]|nr:aldehyde dehydrogenase family protein [Acidimicrobiia bacterium]